MPLEEDVVEENVIEEDDVFDLDEDVDVDDEDEVIEDVQFDEGFAYVTVIDYEIGNTNNGIFFMQIIDEEPTMVSVAVSKEVGLVGKGLVGSRVKIPFKDSWSLVEEMEIV